MSVVGFDFGNESCVIAVAKKKGIHVLQNDTGNRKTAAVVALADKQRLVGDEGLAQSQSNFKNTFLGMKRYLGMNSDDPALSKERVFFKTVDINGKAGFEGKYDGKTESFLPEQITAALLAKLKLTAEKGMENQQVTDCVIGVPSFWTDVQRQAMLDSAKLAGLNVLRLMNETTAVALNYGILRPLPKDEASKVVFLDIGKCSTVATVVSFVAGKLEVLSTACDQNLGGRDFDHMLAEHFSAYIKEKYKLDVYTNTKGTLKLYKECERVKRILSANLKVVFNVEFIMNDTDVKGEIERPVFEDMVSKNITPKIIAVIQKALDAANLKTTDITSTEVVGGTTRIPIVQKELATFFGKEVSKTCDSDESVARGCALQCAMLSPAFRVREFDVHDITPYAIEVQWGPAPDDISKAAEAEIEQTSPLFTVNNSIPSVKMISFKDRTKPFQLVARYADPEAVIGKNPLLGRFTISGMPAPVADEKVPKIKVRVRLNIHGMVDVSSAQLLVVVEDEEMAPVADEKVEAAAEAPTETPAEPAAEEAEEAKMDETDDKEKSADEKPADENPAEDKAAEDKAAEEKPAEKAEEKAEEKKKKRIRKDLVVTPYVVGGLKDDSWKVCSEREATMSLNDKVIAETNECRNALESYCLEMRSRAEDDLGVFFESAAKEKFLTNCTEFEDWLYEDGEYAQKSELKAKLKELTDVGDAALKREFETEHRPEGVAAVKKEIGHWEKLASSEDEKYSHIEAEQRKKVTDACTAADEWLSLELGKQDKLPKSSNPTLSCDALRAKGTSLRKTCSPIMNKSKPPPPKPEPVPEPEKAAAPAEGEAAPAEGEATPATDDAKPEDAKAAETTGDADAAPAEAPVDDAAPKHTDMEMD